MILEIVVLLLLVLINAVLTAGEMALASVPAAALQAPGAHTAQRLALNPSPIQAAVQVGATGIAVLAGAFAGVTLGLRFAGWLGDLGVPDPAAAIIGVLVLVKLTAIFMLVGGELVPRQLALRHPLRFATALAPTLSVYLRIAAPAVTAVEFLGRVFLGLLGQGRPVPPRDPAGLLPAEDAPPAPRLPDHLTAADIAIPLADLATLPLSPTPQQAREALETTRLPAIPLRDPDTGHPLGFAAIADLARLAAATGETPQSLPTVTTVPPLPATADVPTVIAALTASPLGLVPVVDTDGKLQGIATAAGLLAKAQA
jgi:putative hemolysin